MEANVRIGSFSYIFFLKGALFMDAGKYFGFGMKMTRSSGKFSKNWTKRTWQ